MKLNRRGFLKAVAGVTVAAPIVVNGSGKKMPTVKRIGDVERVVKYRRDIDRFQVGYFLASGGSVLHFTELVSKKEIEGDMSHIDARAINHFKKAARV